jgi:hypothetical protein
MPSLRVHRSYLITGLSTLFALVMVAVFSLTLGSKSLADTGSATSTVSNTAPAVSSLIVSDRSRTGDISQVGFTPHEGRTRTLYVRGTVTDPNGCADIRSVDVKVFRSGAGESCAQNDNYCYASSTQALIGCSVSRQSATFEVGVEIAYLAEPTDAGSLHELEYWFAQATAVDQARARFTASTHFEMNSLAAFDVSPATVDYGTIDLGAVSEQRSVTFRNTGNRNVQGAVRAAGDLKSDRPGFAQVSSTMSRVSLSNGFEWQNGIPLGSSDVDLFLNLARQLLESRPSTATAYFRLKMPQSGVSGKYSNQLIFTARAY